MQPIQASYCVHSGQFQTETGSRASSRKCIKKREREEQISHAPSLSSSYHASFACGPASPGCPYNIHAHNIFSISHDLKHNHKGRESESGQSSEKLLALCNHLTSFRCFACHTLTATFFLFTSNSRSSPSSYFYYKSKSFVNIL